MKKKFRLEIIDTKKFYKGNQTQPLLDLYFDGKFILKNAFYHDEEKY